jgi:hypothetical protein
VDVTHRHARGGPRERQEKTVTDPANGSTSGDEADCLDAGQAGWSVTAIGPSREVTDPDDIGRLQKIDLSSWAYGSQELFIRISPEILNGRRLRAHGQEDGHGADRF